MILADKIIDLRKKNGWSQEELAEKLNVSRQSVSKWEGAQSIPDLDKILLMSKIFGVTTDYLLKDEMGEAEYLQETNDEPAEPACRKVSLKEANELLALKEANSVRVAFGVMLCILSPVLLIFMGGSSECGMVSFSEDQAGMAGMIVLLLMVALAVAIFITCGMKSSKFGFMEKELIETEYGVTGMAKERRAVFQETYTRNNVIGVCLCILSLIPLFVTVMFGENDFYYVIAVCVMLVMIAVGVFAMVRVGIIWGGFNMLLEEGDYSRRNKYMESGILGAVSDAYWIIVVAVFLIWGLTRNAWSTCWIVWPVAALIYVAWKVVAEAVIFKNKNKKF
ncbi:MAG: helix-turn-helix transcriptional regulator [Firmicutes bacterium]|nr:helix-turn-helix transcriptional regulator [Bacillota bacterium]